MLPQPEALNVLLDIIVSRYFSNFLCFYLITGNDSRLTFHDKNDYLFVSFSMDSENLQLANTSCEGFVIQTRNPLMNLEWIENALTTEQMTSFNNRLYLFLPENGDYEDDVFQYARFHDILHLLMVNASVDSYNLWTHKYAGRNEYVPELLDEWFVGNASFKVGNNLFPNMLHLGRIFNVGAFTYEPYTNLETMHGIEIQLITEYVRRYNMTLNITKSTEKWGNIFVRNKTGTGILGAVMKNELDVAIGAFYYMGNKIKFFDVAMPTIRIGNTCLVPSPRIVTGLMTPVLTFKYKVWLIIFLIILTYVLILEYLRKRALSDNCLNNPTFNVISIFLQQPVCIISQPNYVYYRRITAGIIFSSWVISVYYSSKMYSIMTNPKYTDAIRTVQDLDNSGYRWGASHISYADGLFNSDRYVNLLSKLVINDDKTLLELLYAGNFGLLIEHLNHGYALRSKVTAEDMKYYSVMKEDLYWAYGAMLIKKHSVLQPSLQSHVMLAREGGLHLVWEQLSFLENNYAVQMEMKISIIKKTTVSLTIHHVKGVLAMWLFGIIAATLSFSFEHLLHYCRKNN